LAVLQGYLLPLLYGWIGATAYVVRSLSREARERLYRRENDTAYTLRIFLGSLAGLAIGWFLKPEDVTASTRFRHSLWPSPPDIVSIFSSPF
jgi:hypothetical protein